MMNDLSKRECRGGLRSGLSLAACAMLGATLLLALSGTAVAQRQRRQPKVIQLEEIKIEGRVQKPNAFYILNRSNIGYEVMDLRTIFLHQVVMSVQQEPF